MIALLRWLVRFLYPDLFPIGRCLSAATAETDRSSSAAVCVSLAATGGCVGGKVICGIGPPVYSAMSPGAPARSEIASGADVGEGTRPESHAVPCSKRRST